MEDKEFAELQLKATIVPGQVDWPDPNVQVSLRGEVPTVTGIHWVKLHAAADEARERVAQTLADFDVIDQDPDLSLEGKARQKKRVAAEAIAALEQ